MKTYSFSFRLCAFLFLMLFIHTATSQTSLFVSSTKNVYIKATTLSANGHVTNNGVISGTSTGILNLNGTSTQNINGTASNATTFGKIIISNTTGASLGTNVDVTGATGLDFVSGPLTLNAATIRFGTGSAWANNNTSTKFFITNGVGMVSARNSGAAIIYPVGIATGAANYTPITVTNGGTADNYAVRVQSGFRTSYNADGTSAGSAVTSNVVNVSWIVNEATVGGSTLTVHPQWNSGNETAGFTRGSSIVGLYQSSSWIVSSSGAASSGGLSGPYSRSYSFSNGNVTFLPVVIGNSLSPLPIELLDFTVTPKNKDALLNWSTASEINNDRFEIERSLDGISFGKIGVKKGAGNSTEILEYALTDVEAAALISSQGVIYYRLKQIDFDGKYSYSAVQSVLFESGSAFSIYPNPTHGDLLINYESAADYEIIVRVFDILGAVVKQVKLHVDEGGNNLTLDLNELANGQYKIMIITPNAVSTHKIIVSN